MARRFAAHLFIATALFCCSASCSGDGDAPRYKPRQLTVDATISSMKQAPLAIYNPSSKTQRFQIKTSSPQIFVDPSQLSIKPDSREILQVNLFCPREVADFREEITITTADHSQIIPVDLRCHLAPHDGSATLAIDLRGLPPGGAGNIQIQGPDFTSLLLTSSETITDLPIGAYQLIASPVESADESFSPLVAEQDFSLDDGDELHLTVEYALPEEASPGSLHLIATGLPEEEQVSYEITGPRGYRARFAFPTYFQDLPPGAYTLELPDHIQPQDSAGHRLFHPRSNPHHLYLPPGGAVEEEVHFDDSFLVTTLDEGTPGSLRALIESAPTGSVITISDNLPEIRLTDGPIPIEKDLIIRGTNRAAPITTDGAHGVFQIPDGVKVHLQNLTFSNAAGLGHPALENDGELHLQDIELRESADFLGPPAILSRGILSVEGLVLEENTSERGPGAVHIEAGTAQITNLKARANQGALAGVLLLEAKTTITDSFFTQNTAQQGAAITSRLDLTLKNSAFTDNQALGDNSRGGAVLIEGLSRITNSTFLQNTASQGAQIALNSGRLELAHLTFASTLELENDHLFVDQEGHLVARNTLFTGLSSGPPSLEIAPGATLESRGGNFLPAPPNLWPRHLLTPTDLLHIPFDPTRLLMPLLHQDLSSPALALPKDHPGRFYIPGHACRDARGTPLDVDQLGQERNIDYFCDTGAHQSQAELLWETFSPLDPEFSDDHGILQTQAGLSWTLQGATIPDFGPLTLNTDGFMRTPLDQSICRLAIISKAEESSHELAILEITAEFQNPQETRRYQQNIPGQDWRSFGLSFPKAPSALKIAAPGQALNVAALLWAHDDCP